MFSIPVVVPNQPMTKLAIVKFSDNTIATIGNKLQMEEQKYLVTCACSYMHTHYIRRKCYPTTYKYVPFKSSLCLIVSVHMSVSIPSLPEIVTYDYII